MGIIRIIEYPTVLFALNPLYALKFLQSTDLTTSLIVFGAVVLAITGVEALYADMGHFGAKTIRTAWLYLVFPALILNYFGQGATVLVMPEAAKNPFFYDVS